ncbi:MAG TPA: uroporphyrinogen-III C-methyltransferase [Chitinophagaceae bacterium]|nr:uroporphyrinogen-III C-methyltransferase [Chitinophagaceae bacterium]
MREVNKKGKVIIAGAGPGDAELITLKLQKRLAEADVIITDRLVNQAIIKNYSRKDAEVIIAGKQGYNDASATREKINSLIIEHSLKGKTVLRLKGGDVAFFSNVLDELMVLKQQQVPFEIIPGITAASGASAYAGIPLTARNYSQGVQWLTYNPNSSYTAERWKELAFTTDTLVFYMSAKNIIELAGHLLQYKSHANTAIAVIEQATTIHQQVHTTTLQDCAKDFAAKNFSSPSLVIIGEVVKLHQQFNWYKAEEAGTIFHELEK